MEGEGRSLCLPSVTPRRAGRPRGYYKDRSGSIEARAVGYDPLGHQRPVGVIDEPGFARPMDTSSTSRGRCGGGVAVEGGQ